MRAVFVDANVLLRFLVGDPPPMAAQARDLLAQVEDGTLILVVDEIVVAEMVWVLSSFHGYPAQKIASVLQELLIHDGFQMANRSSILAALTLYAEKNVDFIDALLSIHMRQLQIDEIYTFDRHFERLPGVVPLRPGAAESSTDSE